MKLLKKVSLLAKLCFSILTYKISFKNFLSIFDFKFFKNKSEDYKNELDGYELIKIKYISNSQFIFLKKG